MSSPTPRSRSVTAGVAFAVAGLLAAGSAGAQPLSARSSEASAAATVGGTPTIPVIHPSPGTTTGPVPHVPTGPLPLVDRVIGLPSAASCVKRLRVVLSRPSGVHLRSLSIKVGERHVKRRPVPRSITFRILPKGHFTLAVTVTTTTNRHLSRSRRYDRCQ